MRLLLVDNYDSFTHNLAHRLAEAGARPIVVPNDTPFERLPLGQVAGVVLSPGPGRPERAADFGVCRALIERATVPLLGVCLGHQGIGAAFGCPVVPAPQVMHGRLSRLHHTGDDPLFAGVPQGCRVVRYHSLMLGPLPPSLRALAHSDDGVLMALRHTERPLWGVQFHPESVCTADGPRLLANFVGLCARWHGANHRLQAAPPPVRPRRRPAPSHRLVYRSVERDDGRPIDPERAFGRLFHGQRGAYWLDTATGGRHIMGAAGADGPIVEHRVGSGADLFGRLAAALQQIRVAPDPGRPFPFAGGWVGCLGYGLEAECDDGPARIRAVGPSDHPDALLVRADRFVVIDGPRAWVATVEAIDGMAGDGMAGDGMAGDGMAGDGMAGDGMAGDGMAGDGMAGDGMAGDGMASAAQARWRAAISERLRTLQPLPPPGPPCRTPPVFRPDRDAERYRADIEVCFAELAAGESYEVCLTTHLRTPTPVDPLALHRRLRRDNPAPYAALLELGSLSVVSASPERFLRVEADGAVEARPIKGTRARHPDPAVDSRARDDLQHSEKDRAENLMICDLLRNDLARVCAPGSVRVPELMRVESYATVHQLVSAVTGRLRADASAVDCARAAFPGGSMTGAPKRRTMAIIDRLEGRPRGIYSGALGWFGFDGAADLSIVIRTAVIDDAGCSIGVGGAIVALSDPEAEIDEMRLKARALIDAMGGRLEDPADGGCDRPAGRRG